MTRRMGLWGIAVIALALIAGGSWWMLRVRSHPLFPVRPIGKLPSNIELRLDHVIFRGISNGKVAWEIEADHFDLTKDQMTFKVGGLKKVALLKDGKQELTISASDLERNTISGDIVINGHVTVMGPDMIFRTPSVAWSDRLQMMTIPHKIAAQLGDITLIADEGTVYNVANGYMRSSGKLVLTVGGNTLRASGVVIDTNKQIFTLNGPVHADIIVDDLQQWLVGQNQPKIPEIPADIKARYQDYCRRRGY